MYTIYWCLDLWCQNHFRTFFHCGHRLTLQIPIILKPAYCLLHLPHVVIPVMLIVSVLCQILTWSWSRKKPSRGSLKFKNQPLTPAFNWTFSRVKPFFQSFDFSPFSAFTTSVLMFMHMCNAQSALPRHWNLILFSYHMFIANRSKIHRFFMISSNTDRARQNKYICIPILSSVNIRFVMPVCYRQKSWNRNTSKT